MASCPFCGSESTVIETPFVRLDGTGKYSPERTFCCGAQKKNHQYDQKHFHPIYSEKPTVDINED